MVRRDLQHFKVHPEASPHPAGGRERNDKKIRLACHDLDLPLMSVGVNAWRPEWQDKHVHLGYNADPFPVFKMI